ncbi:MAG: ESPR-type extended signal peptide-containing protein [Negativicoccus succinicivorans]|uniref:ESPR-type extended signal peptide-containing protein n=1 Tax=Negativicoccus succinicivorans TaxID=620903 RepID=UPI0028FF4C83|nr:ESPR-type extended signal peptide-containing protein [Negativicoccus succinicivorans]MDU2643789.1 ESPR-type extended signal peptide-containing protein [Negativicoccus succinicivorans]MDU5657377.1 ESPR-type extended signal peptide-containing protein [Negativicoccus succinicivorans]
MNKIYKLIWSKVKNCWVVTSEMANSHVKSTSGRAKGSVLAASVLTVLLGSALFPADMVYAADGAAHYVNVAVNTGKTIEARKYPGETIEESAIDPDVNYDLSANPTINAISIGAEASAWNNGAVAMGFKTIAKGEYATALGTGSAAYSKGDLALGWKAYTGWNEPNKIAIGTESTALKENGISIGTKSKTWYDNAIAIGNEAETGNKGGVTSNDSIAIGNKAKIQGQKNVAIGSEVTVGTGSTSSGSSYVVAIGSDSHAYDTDSVVVGGHSEVRENAVVVGNRSKAGMQSVAVGSDIKAGEWSVAIGLSSKAKNHAIAMGYSSEASAVDSVAFGNNASAKGLGAIAIGGNYDRPNEGAQAYSGDTIAIGRGSVAGNKEDTATVYNSVAVGREARAYGKNSIALGGTANVGDIWQKQLADGGTAIGSSANAAMENATAIGYKSIAYAKDAVTLGANTRADIDGGVALGSESNVGSYSSSSYGKAGKVGYDPLGAGADETSTWKATKAAVSVGNQQKDITRQIINVAAGSDDTDAVNVAQLKTLGRKAWKDLAAAKDELGARIASNTTSITALSGRVRTNEGDIGRLKTDVSTNDSRIRYLYNNMPFMHYVSVNEKNTNKTTDNRGNDGAKAVGSIAIGVNTHAYGEDAVALGGNSFVRGQGSVIVGESSDNYTGGLAAKEGQFDQSVILGSNNTIFAQAAKNGGREDKIIGNMNRVEESHGTFVRGTGNMVYDAYNDEALTDEDKQKEQDFLDPIDGGNPKGLFQKGRSHVTVGGDGNLVGGALYTQVSGVGNEVSNSQPDENSPSTPRVTYNIVTGNRNTVVDSSHNLIMGDNHELEKVNGNIIIGSQKAKTKTEKSNVTILGNDANVSEEGGVALGTGSVASTAAGVFGYDPATDKASTTDNATWKSGNGAVSVGTTDKTRQITNLAAGLADTDAVNVAQLKNSKTAVEAGDYVTVTKKAEDGKGTTYTVKGPNLTSVDKNLTVTDDKDASDKKVGYKLQLSKTLTGLDSVSSKVFNAGNNVTLGETGLTITGGPSVTTTGINANNTTITNVAAGAADGDAVNFKQLKDVKAQVETNKGNITKNTTAIEGLKPSVSTNTTNIGNLQKGFIVKDGGTGKANVTLGGDKKQEVTFKAAVDKTTQATENGSSLTSTVDTDRNVTYKLNMNQLKKDLGITEGPGGVMSSWKLKATGGDTTEQDIKNGEAVTFDVAAADKGLTVTRDGKTIKYGIEGNKIDIANNQSITNLGKRIDNLPSIHYFSVNSTDKGADSNYKNDGATGKNAIAIGQKTKAGKTNDIAIGTEAAATGGFGFAAGHLAKASGNADIAIGANAEATGGWGVAIGQDTKAQASTAVAMAYGANAKGSNSLAIGVQSEAKTNDSTAYGREAKALGEVALAVGMRAKAEGDHSAVFGAEATTDSTAWNGTAIGRGAYIGKQAADGTTPNIGVSDNYYTPVDDDTVVEPGKETKNSTAVGFGAKSFGYQNTALGAGAEAFDTNTVAVGVMSKAIGHYANAFGKQARAEGKNSTAIGHFARALGESSMALGDYAITSILDGTGKVNQSVALGSHARVAADNSLALGYNSLASIADDVDTEAYLSKEAFKKENGVVSVGNKAYTIGDETIAQNYRRITNVAGGADDNDAVNVLQLKALETKVTGNADNITKGWVLKATSDTGEEKKGKTINNTNNEVTFGVEDDAQGLTVKRTGANVQYGVDKEKLASHITGDVVTNINKGGTAVTNIAAKFSVTDGKNTKAVNLGKDKNNNVTFKGTDGETTVTVGGDNDAPTVTVGLDPKFKKQVADNTADIATNKADIATNKADIATNKADIATNKADIATNKADIATNKADIATNKADIATNKADIATNKADIATNKANIATNKADIATNKADIATNKADIATNKADIATNKADIATNKADIATNKADIATNKADIATNKADIAENKAEISKKMTSWNLKAEGVDGEQKIENNGTVTFGVVEKDKGLTVTREGSTIKYGIDGSKIDLSQNESLNKLKTTVKAGDYVTVSEDTNVSGGKEYTVTGPKLAVVDGEENLVVGDITEGDKKVGYNLKLNKELKGLTSVSSDTFKAGDKVTINNEGLTIKDGPSVTTKGIDAGGKTITNVADGQADTDAVNVRQLNAITNQSNQNIAILGGKVSELDGRIDRVGAGAAALAALHPLDFDPDDKWDFAAGYGNYSGANAVAIGAYYRPNEDTMFSVGGSFGGGENMVNAGVSVKLGQGNNVTTSKIAMAKEIKDLRAEVEVLRQAIVGVGQGQELDPMKMKLFPDIEKNHWAYEAVEELAKQGLLEGYPDGTFGGDRMMTRYEFAEVVYRAMQKGLKVNERLIQEFEPELERFRIDVISKDKDGNPVIERVRANQQKAN